MSGILWVASEIVEPSCLSVEDFDAWYEDDHAPSVLALPSVPSATRYTAVPPTPPPHLITYEFPDLTYAESPAFQRIAGTEPEKDEADKIYKNVAFDIRFYAEIPTSRARRARSPRKDECVAWIHFPPATTTTTNDSSWAADELHTALERVPGFMGLRQFSHVSGVVRNRNVVCPGRETGGLIEVRFSGVGEEGRRRRVEGVVGKIGGVEARWFGVKRVWGGRESKL